MLDYLLLCVSHDAAKHTAGLAKDPNLKLVQKYLGQKAEQIQSKLGITVDKDALVLGQNFVEHYMQNLAVERVTGILKSFRNSMKNLLKALVDELEKGEEHV